MTNQLILKNLKQNDVNGFLKSSKYYNDALKYYGYENSNQILYPLPIIKHSKTYMSQASLQSLPVQPLNNSLQKYLAAVKPLLNDNEYENTKTIVDKFLEPGEVGEKLQKLLYERSKKTNNWVD
jgi:hypothetical protein